MQMVRLSRESAWGLQVCTSKSEHVMTFTHLGVIRKSIFNSDTADLPVRNAIFTLAPTALFSVSQGTSV